MDSCGKDIGMEQRGIANDRNLSGPLEQAVPLAALVPPMHFTGWKRGGRR